MLEFYTYLLPATSTRRRLDFSTAVSIQQWGYNHIPQGFQIAELQPLEEDAHVWIYTLKPTSLVQWYWLNNTCKVKIQNFQTLNNPREILAPWGDKEAQYFTRVGWPTQKEKGTCTMHYLYISSFCFLVLCVLGMDMCPLCQRKGYTVKMWEQ